MRVTIMEKKGRRSSAWLKKCRPVKNGFGRKKQRLNKRKKALQKRHIRTRLVHPTKAQKKHHDGSRWVLESCGKMKGYR